MLCRRSRPQGPGQGQRPMSLACCPRSKEASSPGGNRVPVLPCPPHTLGSYRSGQRTTTVEPRGEILRVARFPEHGLVTHCRKSRSSRLNMRSGQLQNNHSGSSTAPLVGLCRFTRSAITEPPAQAGPRRAEGSALPRSWTQQRKPCSPIGQPGPAPTFKTQPAVVIDAGGCTSVAVLRKVWAWASRLASGCISRANIYLSG